MSMFAFAQNDEVLWPVTVMVPKDGGPQPLDVKVRYKILTDKKAKALAELTPAEQFEVFLDHVTGWEDMPGVDGKDVPFSKENLRAVMEYSFIKVAFQRGWRECSTGAPVKNSKPGLGG